MGLLLKYGESNAKGSALNTWQMPQTAHQPYITLTGSLQEMYQTFKT